MSNTNDEYVRDLLIEENRRLKQYLKDSDEQAKQIERDYETTNQYRNRETGELRLENDRLKETMERREQQIRWLIDAGERLFKYPPRSKAGKESFELSARTISSIAEQMVKPKS